MLAFVPMQSMRIDFFINKVAIKKARSMAGFFKSVFHTYVFGFSRAQMRL